MTQTIENLLIALLAVVNSEGATWQEKRDRVLDVAKNNDAEAALEEFISWFEKESE